MQLYLRIFDQAYAGGLANNEHAISLSTQALLDSKNDNSDNGADAKRTIALNGTWQKRWGQRLPRAVNEWELRRLGAPNPPIAQPARTVLETLRMV